MMDINNYLMNINRTIGENARYARQFQADQQNGSINTSASSVDPNNIDTLNSTIFLLLFQLLNQLMTQNGYGLPSANAPLNYSPNISSPIGSGSLGSLPALPVQTAQNPAYTYLNSVLKQTQPNPIDFEDNISIQKRLDDIFASSPNTAVQDLAYQVRSTVPDAPTMPAMHDQLKTMLKAEGRTDQELQELDILWQAQLANHSIPLLEIQAAGFPSEELTNQIAALKQSRSDAAAQWETLYSTNGLSQAELAGQVQAELKKGSFTESQLGSSLKYLLDQGPIDSAAQTATLASDLMESGDLNITPFLANDYLERLAPERQQALLTAVKSSGLLMASGKPNSRFIGFMVESLYKPGDFQTKAFLQQFLQDSYQANGADPTTADGKLLADVLSLADVQTDTEGQLVFH